MPPVSTILSYVQLTRPKNVSGSALTYFIGYFLVRSYLRFDFFIGLAILLILHSLATVQNDIEDFEIDKANRRKSVLQNSSLSLSDAKLLVQALAFLALGFALLSTHRRLHVIAITGLLLIAWMYNLNPIRASKKPVMSILLMGICYGALPFIYGYFVAGGKVTAYFLGLAFFFLLVRLSTSIMKDYKDIAGDKAFNKETFYLHYGGKVTAWTSIVTSAIAYLGIVGMLIKLKDNNSILLITLALASLLALRSIFLRLKLTKTRSEKKLNNIFHKTIYAHIQFEAAVLLCLILPSR
jgi:4-hydroxybenzoate polyprenyltransferase